MAWAEKDSLLFLGIQPEILVKMEHISQQYPHDLDGEAEGQQVPGNIVIGGPLGMPALQGGGGNVLGQQVRDGEEFLGADFSPLP